MAICTSASIGKKLYEGTECADELRRDSGVTHEHELLRQVAVHPGGRHRGGLAPARQPRDRAQPRSLGPLMTTAKESPTPLRRKRGRHGRTSSRVKPRKAEQPQGRRPTQLEMKVLRRGGVPKNFDVTNIRMSPSERNLYRRALRLAS